MKKLKKLLSESSKIRRNRGLLLNIQVQFLAWLLEVLSAVIAILMFLSPFSMASIYAEHFVHLGYLVIVPSMYLVNSYKFKTVVMENKWYLAFTNKFFPKIINNIVPENEPSS